VDSDNPERRAASINGASGLAIMYRRAIAIRERIQFVDRFRDPIDKFFAI
jgi:hypothetical protein